MATDPFDLLARQAAAKSDLRLEQAKIVSVVGTTATVALRGGNVAGVPFIGTPPVAGTRVWLLVDRGTVVGLAGGSGGGAPGVTDHGALTGLGDDDHPQYLKPVEVVAGARISVDTATQPGSVIITGAAPPAVITDHGNLTGLADDDHPQYLKPAEVVAGARISVDTTTTPGSVIITGAAPPAVVTDHGALTGLTDDDHPQYLKPVEVLAGSNVTVDTTTTPGSVIIGSSSSALPEVFVQPAPPGPGAAAVLWVDEVNTIDGPTGIQAVPIGAVIAFGGSVAPVGWHLCNGTAHGSVALQNVIGSPNAPDLRDRFIAGAGSAYAVGATGGKGTHALTNAEMPSHSHGGYTGNDAVSHQHHMTTSGHGGTPPGTIGVGAGQTGILGGDSGTLTPGLARGLSDAYAWGIGVGEVFSNHYHVMNAEGGNAAHENRPPYYALTYIIRKA